MGKHKLMKMKKMARLSETELYPGQRMVFQFCGSRQVVLLREERERERDGMVVEEVVLVGEEEERKKGGNKYGW